jgi:hypothetical protein
MCLRVCVCVCKGVWQPHPDSILITPEDTRTRACTEKQSRLLACIYVAIGICAGTLAVAQIAFPLPIIDVAIRPDILAVTLLLV